MASLRHELGTVDRQFSSTFARADGIDAPPFEPLLLPMITSVRLVFLCCAWTAVWSATALAAPSAAPSAQRLLFLGDSITYAGHFVEIFEAWLRLRYPDWRGEVANAGLPSETVSGLSEDGHAGGQFPRPDLHERLTRVLDAVRPDCVVACYGMNDGIYLDWDEQRFQRFRAGIEKLREQVRSRGARMIHVTPPTFDPPAGSNKPFNYDRVLDRYAEWLVGQRTHGWEVIDLHRHMGRHLEERRKSNPSYRLAPDGVHPTEAGHWVIAQPLLQFFGAADRILEVERPMDVLGAYSRGAEVLALVQEKQRWMKDSWLSHARHLRPGMKRGIPLPEALAKAEELNRRIQEALPY